MNNISLVHTADQKLVAKAAEMNATSTRSIKTDCITQDSIKVVDFTRVNIRNHPFYVFLRKTMRQQLI